MTRRISHLVFAGMLAGLCLSGIACGGSKPESQPTNVPVGKPAEGSAGPVAGGLTNDAGAKMPDDSAKAQRK